MYIRVVLLFWGGFVVFVANADLAGSYSPLYGETIL